MSRHVGANADPQRVREGIAALRAWFFTSFKSVNDPTDIAMPFPSLPEIELIDKMDEPPPGAENTPLGELLLFDVYTKFEQTASKGARGGLNGDEKRNVELAMRARYLLNLSPNFKTVPDINVGVRFFCHLSHALKTVTGLYKFNDQDPCTVINLPLDVTRLSHLVPPCFYTDPSEEHKKMWCVSTTEEYEREKFIHKLDEDFKWNQALGEAFPGVKMGVLCPSCKCASHITNDIAEVTSSLGTYTNKMSRFCCSHCGLYFSCLNPNAEVFFDGIKEKRSV